MIVGFIRKDLSSGDQAADSGARTLALTGVAIFEGNEMKRGEKITYVFTCNHCNCMTPMVANIPADARSDQQIQLSGECFHCDAKLTENFASLKILRAAVALQESGE